MNVDYLDKFEQLKKYLKYAILIVSLIIALFLIKGCSSNYKSLEAKIEASALEYVKKNNLVVNNEDYLELSLLGDFEGTELCSKASGVVVKNENGTLKASAYLKCPNYETSLLKTKGKYIELNGDAIVLLNSGEVFNDPLYVLNKEVRVDITGAVGSVPGVYTIYYRVFEGTILKETLMRKIIVSQNDKTSTISGIENLTEPALTLYGDTEMVLLKGETYVEPGYKAVDYEDGKISRQVVVSPKRVSTENVGTTIITYSVTNSRGVTAIKTRTINVISKRADINIELTSVSSDFSNKVNLEIKVTGSDFAYMLLPDNTRVLINEYSYPVSDNGIYLFKVYDNFGNQYSKSISVDNIDKVPPSGVCKATIKSGKTMVYVSAQDNKGVAGYSYILDDEVSPFVSSNSYEVQKEVKKASVNLKDIAGNNNTISCEVENENQNQNQGGTIITGSCGGSDIYLNVVTCFGGTLIRQNIPLEDYLIGVLYGEEDPGVNDDEDYVKAFLVFARTYTLNRIGYFNGKNNSIRSCSSDQNWCDYNEGCYRNQTDSMFDACIKYSINHASNGVPYYTAQKCADRVTTFPGNKSVSNKTFYVNNSSWPSGYETSATSKQIVSSWKKPVSSSKLEFYKRMVQETEGLILKTSDGKPTSVNYYMCDATTKESTLCPNTAEKLANQGYTFDQIIKAYSTKYPNATVGCYNK